MGAGRLKVNDLDFYVAECDRLGGVQSPGAFGFLSDFSLDLTDFDVNGLDPFSEEYFQIQIKVYECISGRKFDQSTGELFEFDLESHVKSQNPYNNKNVSYVATHVRAVAAAIAMANLSASPRILDMGSGWGMTSELAAFLGASVKAVDINPRFVDLINRRAERSGMPIAAELSTFDTFTDESKYNAILYYECLHHAPKVWETLTRAKNFLEPGGKIIFAGEPITEYYWKHWGIRTDSLSVYCIRKYGWYETGWSAEFLKRAFAFAGLDLRLYPYAGMQNTEIGIATRYDEVSSPDTPDLVFPYTHLADMVNAAAVKKTLEQTQKMHHELSQVHHKLALEHHQLSKAHHKLELRNQKLQYEYATLSQFYQNTISSKAARFLKRLGIAKTR